jgi:hypothetical protein
MIFNYYTTYIRVKQSQILKIIGNPYTKGSFIKNFHKIFCRSSTKRVSFTEKMREEIGKTEKISCYNTQKKSSFLTHLKKNTSILDDSNNFEHMNSKINLVVQNNNKDTDKLNNKSIIQIKLENLDLLEGNENFSFRNEINFPTDMKDKDKNNSSIGRSNTCRIKFEVTIRHKMPPSKTSFPQKGTTL